MARGGRANASGGSVWVWLKAPSAVKSASAAILSGASRRMRSPRISNSPSAAIRWRV